MYLLSFVVLKTRILWYLPSTLWKWISGQFPFDLVRTQHPIHCPLFHCAILGTVLSSHWPPYISNRSLVDIIAVIEESYDKANSKLIHYHKYKLIFLEWFLL
jgi:hypothetical protein